MKSLAYVDDDAKNLAHLKSSLAHKFQVQTFINPNDFLESLKNSSFDSYIFDLYMPAKSGFELTQELIKSPFYNNAPVFYVTSNPDDEIRIKSFQNGGVDFFDRTISILELTARLESRISVFEKGKFRYNLGNMAMDLKNMECIVGGVLLNLTLIEFKILSHYLKHHPRVTSKDSLVRDVWGSMSLNNNNINTHIYNLREKISGWDFEIISHKSKGSWLSRKTT